MQTGRRSWDRSEAYRQCRASSTGRAWSGRPSLASRGRRDPTPMPSQSMVGQAVSRSARALYASCALTHELQCARSAVRTNCVLPPLQRVGLELGPPIVAGVFDVRAPLLIQTHHGVAVGVQFFRLLVLLRLPPSTRLPRSLGASAFQIKLSHLLLSQECGKPGFETRESFISTTPPSLATRS